MDKWNEDTLKGSTLEFKELAIERVILGQSIAETARELGVIEQTLWNWARRIVGWRLSHSAKTDFVLDALAETISGLYKAEVIYKRRSWKQKLVLVSEYPTGPGGLTECQLILDHVNTMKVAPNGAASKAIAYTLRRWDSLERYASTGNLSVDNNAIEQDIRPIAVGKKNWLCVSRRRTYDVTERKAA